VGVDLGKKQDYTWLGVVRQDPDVLRLCALKGFPLGTEYTGVIGYLKILSERLQTVHRFLIDQTGVGEAFLDEAKKSVPNIEGVVLTVPVKQDILGHLKMQMQQKRVLIPYQLELANELNVERFELTKSGQIQFSHPAGTHDDRLWAVALAVYASKSAPTGTLLRVKRTA
jgi:phage FluMu gp28-like protein